MKPANKITTILNYCSLTLIFTLIIGIFSFNDKIEIVYPIKVLFILVVGFISLLIKTRISFFIKWSITFLFYSLLSILWASDQSLALFYFFWTTQAILIAMVFNSFCDNKKKVEFVFKVIAFSGIILSFRLLTAVPIQFWGSVRIGNEIGYQINNLALKLSVSALCSLYFLRNETNKIYYKIYYIMSIGLIFFTSLLTGSRKSFFIIVFASILFLLLTAKNKITLIRNILLLFGIVYVLFMLIMKVDFLYNVTGNRIESLLMSFTHDSVYLDGSSRIRQEMIQKGIKLFFAKPTFGYGIGNFSFVSGSGGYSHNNFVEILVGGGLIGFLIYYYLYIVFLKNTTQILLARKNVLLCFFLSFFLALLVSETGLVTFQSDYILIMIALGSSYLSKTIN